MLIHLSLHRHFIQNNRPVPNFLFLDQPSQGYNLSKDKVSISENLDEKQKHYENMFSVIYDAVNSLEHKFQIILTDHINLEKNEKFQKSIIEEWRNGMKLIPPDWYE